MVRLLRLKKLSKSSKTAPKKESLIQSEILRWCESHGYEAWRNALGPILQRRGGMLVYGKNPMSGFPDISGLLKIPKGQFFACEIKSKEGKLSAKQKIRIKKLEDKGAFCIVVRSLEEFIELLKKEEGRNDKINTACCDSCARKLEHTREE